MRCHNFRYSQNNFLYWPHPTTSSEVVLQTYAIYKIQSKYTIHEKNYTIFWQTQYLRYLPFFKVFIVKYISEESLDNGPEGGPNFAEILNKALPDSDHSSCDSQSDRSSNSGEVNYSWSFFWWHSCVNIRPTCGKHIFDIWRNRTHGMGGGIRGDKNLYY